MRNLNIKMLNIISLFFIGLLLSGCYEPLYGKYAPQANEGGYGYNSQNKANTKNNGYVMPKDIWFDVIASGQNGVTIRNELKYLMHGVRDKHGRELSLQVTPEFGAQSYYYNYDNERDKVGTKEVKMKYVLKERNTGKILDQGNTRANAAYDIRDNIYSKESAIRDAERRAIVTSLRNVVDRVQIYLSSEYIPN